MTWLTLGSLALPFQLNRASQGLRGDLARLSHELTTGEVRDPQRKLRGDLGAFSAVENRLSRIDAYTEANKLATNAADIAQSALNRAADSGSEVASRMLAVSVEGVSPSSLRAGTLSARTALEDLSVTLGQRVAGRAIFSGTASDTSPLPGADAIMAAVLPTLAGLDNADDIAAAVNAAFVTPGTLFDTAIYQGGAAAAGPAIDTGANAPALPTAADPGLRQLMAGLVISALAGDPALGLADNQNQALARAGAETLMAAAGGMAELQASLGETQARLDLTLTRLSGERDALSLARQNLIGADPYEAASQLEVVQTRLETLYAVTARTSRLSLTEYL